MMANEFADKDADLLLGETQSPQRAQRNAKRVGVEVGEKRWRWRVDDKFFLLRRRPINTTGKGLCVSLRSLRSLRLRNKMKANIVADKIADLLFWETQSSQRAQRNAKRVGVCWGMKVKVGVEGEQWRAQFFVLRRRHTETTGKGLCVSLRSLCSLRLRNKCWEDDGAERIPHPQLKGANEVAGLVVNYLFRETQSPQRAQRNAKRVEREGGSGEMGQRGEKSND